MSAARPEEAIVETALGLPTSERAAYLDQACRENPRLRRLVEGLLRAHGHALATRELHSAAPVVTPTIAATPSEKIGDHIGRYKLLQQIGEGGYGVVYMAEQEEPVRRRVALKVIKLGMDTKQVIARFEAERQALALMDHPNIAKIHDAGVTDSPLPASGPPEGPASFRTPHSPLTTSAGRPYFVMELVRGIKLTDYCDQNNLPTEKRLELFIQVCNAIQHAHQKGIIHRDIKPSNILVTLHDGVPAPKVIDFGIAKATGGQKLTDQTLFTAFEQFVGTPAYMSPEQAEMSGLDIDTRSDVYSLGVLLYELLTGQTPFDPKQMVKAGLDEIRRIIREEEPVRPSTRLSTLEAGEQTTVAKRRHSEPLKLISQVRGDLDWIVMKSLEKDRTRRYETANGLATDIQRHLANEPVVARPPSSFYRLSKLARRNKLLFGATGAVVSALVVGLSMSLWLLVQERAARRQALAAERLQGQLRAQAEVEQLKSRDLAQENHQQLYATRINLAQQAYEQGSVAQVREILESLRPRAGEEDLRGFEWYYLHRLLHLEKARLGADTNETHALAFSSDGRLLATAGTSSTITLWNPATGAQLSALTGHVGTVHALAFWRDHRLLASGGDDGLVRLWDLETGRELTNFAGHGRAVSALAFSPRSNLLASATKGSQLLRGTAIARFTGEVDGDPAPEIRLWEFPSGKLLANFQTHPTGILGLAFSPDGQTLATAGADATVRLWEVPTCRERLVFRRHRGAVYAVSFSADGNTVLSCSHDQLAMLWDPGTGGIKDVFHGHSGPVFCGGFSPDGKLIATGGYDNVARLWDAETGAEIGCLRGHSRYVWGLAFAPDSQMLATASWDGGVDLWDTSRRLEFDVLRPVARKNDPGAYSLAFSPDGSTLASGGIFPRLWNTKNLSERFTAGTTANDALVSFAENGQVLAIADLAGVLRIWDLPSQTERFALRAANAKIWALTSFPAGERVITGDEQGNVGFWNTKSGKEEFRLPPHMTFTRSLALSPDGATLAVLGRNQYKQAVLCLWDVPNQKLSAEIQLQHAASLVRFSPDGKLFTISRQTDDVRNGSFHIVSLWDTQTRQIRRSLPLQSDLVYEAAFSPDSKTLATASWDGTVRLWHVATGSELLTLKGHTMGVMFAVAFSPDGTQLVGCSGRDVSGARIFRWLADDPDQGERVRPPDSTALRQALLQTGRTQPERTNPTPQLQGWRPIGRAESFVDEAQSFFDEARGLARQAQWKKAAAACAKAVEIEPDSHQGYHCLAPLLVVQGDSAAFHELCERMIAHFGTTQDPIVAERMAKDCLILPPTGRQLEGAVRMADTAIAEGENHSYLPFFQFAKGLAEYRQGHFASALEWLDKCLGASNHVAFRDAEACLVRAMAQQQLGRSAEARAALARGQEILETKLPKLDSGDLGGGWDDTIRAHAWLDEAKALIEGRTQSGDPAPGR